MKCFLFCLLFHVGAFSILTSASVMLKLILKSVRTVTGSFLVSPPSTLLTHLPSLEGLKRLLCIRVDPPPHPPSNGNRKQSLEFSQPTHEKTLHCVNATPMEFKFSGLESFSASLRRRGVFPTSVSSSCGLPSLQI